MCPTPTPTPIEVGDAGSCDPTAYWECLNVEGAHWRESPCRCIGYPSPVLIDAAGDGFRLTGAAEGVRFDIDGDGAPERVAWTPAASDDAWLALDRDGVSGPSELSTPAALGVARLHLNYKESKRVDEHGNRFRYRAKVDDAGGSKAGRWAWDVFLVRAP